MGVRIMTANWIAGVGKGTPKSQEGIKMFGAYVLNASTSIGWGGQGGSMQFELVEDPDNGVTIDMPDIGT